MFRSVLAAACAMLLLIGVAEAQPCAQGAATVCQAFDTVWPDGRSRDGLWRVNGPWPGSGGNMLEPSLAEIIPGGPGEGQLTLTVAANEKRGSEIQSLATPGYGYGYYETEMRVTPAPGVCATFFWIEAPQYGPHEWDVEFLTSDFTPGAGAVRLTIHPSNTSTRLRLPFNPSDAFHRYGFLWTPGRIVFTVDGKPARTMTTPELNTSARGFIMANAWTGNRNWCKGPPKQDATSTYKWMRFIAGAAEIPR